MKTIGWLILKYCRECAHCLNKTDTVQYENLPCNMTIIHKKTNYVFDVIRVLPRYMPMG
jgi:hypothetical protein